MSANPKGRSRLDQATLILATNKAARFNIERPCSVVGARAKLIGNQSGRFARAFDPGCIHYLNVLAPAIFEYPELPTALNARTR